MVGRGGASAPRAVSLCAAAPPAAAVPASTGEGLRVGADRERRQTLEATEDPKVPCV